MFNLSNPLLTGIFAVVHYLMIHSYPMSAYLMSWLISWMFGAIMIAINILAGFTTSLMTSSVVYMILLAFFIVAYGAIWFLGIDLTFIFAIKPIVLGLLALLSIEIILYGSYRIYEKQLG